MTRPTKRAKERVDIVAIVAKRLAIGWGKYVLYMQMPPHGTTKQLEALLELSGGNEMLKKACAAALRDGGKHE